MNNMHHMLGPLSTLMAPQLMQQLTNLEWWCWKCLLLYKAESGTLMKAISLAVDSKPEENRGWILTDVLSVLQPLTNNTLSHLAKTTQQQPHSGPSVDNRPLRSSWKLTSRQARKWRCPDRTTSANMSYQEQATITKALMMPSQEKDA